MMSAGVASRWICGALVVLLSVVVGRSQDAEAQTVFVGSGPLFDDPVGADNRQETVFLPQMGARFWLTDQLQIQGGGAYQRYPVAELGMLLRLFEYNKKVEPYFRAKYGKIFSGGEGDKNVYAITAGYDYRLGGPWGLYAEFGVRWTDAGPKETGTDSDARRIVTGIAPSVGVTYRLNGLRRPSPESVPMYQEATVELQQQQQAAVDTSQTDAEPDGRTVTSTGRALSGGRGGGSPYRFDLLEPLAETEDMVHLPDGTFIMGLTDEDPLSMQTAGLKRVSLRNFFISKREATNAEYRQFLASLSSDERQRMLPDSSVWYEEGGNTQFGWTEYFRGSAFDDYPVVAITQEQAQRFCEWKGMRLPTEAEWEYAARSGRLGGIYPWYGLETRDAQGRYLANYNPGRVGYAADGYAFTAPVEAYPPSPWGLYNMAGNVAEWTLDAYSPSYADLSSFNPQHEDPNEERRVVRGGSWASDAFFIGVGVRSWQPKDEASVYIGCRCVGDVAAQFQQEAAPSNVGADSTSTGN